MNLNQPLIGNIKLGEIEVNNGQVTLITEDKDGKTVETNQPKNETFQDVMIYPGGFENWDWEKTGTQNTPGVQVVDVQKIVEKGAKAIVISCGMKKQLGIMKETKDFLTENDVELYFLPTIQAAMKYNILREQKPTGALLHSI